MRKKLVYILINLVFLLTAFLFLAWLKPGTISTVIPVYWKPFVYFAGLWLVISFLLGKYSIGRIKQSKDVIFPIFISNFTILSIVAIVFYSFQLYSFSRALVFGTIGLTTIFELVFGLTYLAFKIPVRIKEDQDIRLNGSVAILTDELVKEHKTKSLKKSKKRLDDEAFETIRQLIINETNEAIFKFINKSIDLRDPRNLIISSTIRFNILNQPDKRFHNVINLARINDIRYINKFFEAVNSKIPDGGLFIDCVETYNLRKRRILRRFPPILNYIYYFFDFIWVRIFPKLPILKKIYFLFTQGYKRVISKGETFGRIYSCGFEIAHESLIEGLLFFCAKKVDEPAFDYNPTYGPIVTLQRYGKGGKLFNVYKLRTMHAYAEYLQQYAYHQNQLVKVENLK